MSEMLGNHYFQLRNFTLAEQNYEQLSSNELADLKVLKKLIICRTQTHKLEQALQLLLFLIESNISTIINISRIEDECPCNDLIYQIECGEIKYLTDRETFIALGILWLYCNYQTSINYFKMALNEDKSNELLKKVLKHIMNYSNQNIFKSN